MYPVVGNWLDPGRCNLRSDLLYTFFSVNPVFPPLSWYPPPPPSCVASPLRLSQPFRFIALPLISSFGLFFHRYYPAYSIIFSRIITSIFLFFFRRKRKTYSLGLEGLSRWAYSHTKLLGFFWRTARPFPRISFVLFNFSVFFIFIFSMFWNTTSYVVTCPEIEHAIYPGKLEDRCENVHVQQTSHSVPHIFSLQHFRKQIYFACFVIVFFLFHRASFLVDGFRRRCAMLHIW